MATVLSFSSVSTHVVCFPSPPSFSWRPQFPLGAPLLFMFAIPLLICYHLFNVDVIRGYALFVSDNTYNAGLLITPHNPTLTQMSTSPELCPFVYPCSIHLPIPYLWGHYVPVSYTKTNRQPQPSTIQYHPRLWRPRPDIQSIQILHLQKPPGQFWPTFIH